MRPQIANDFKHLLPEHSDEELKQLKANCLADPKHIGMPPVIVWAMTKSKHIIIDGHHQFDIRSKNALKTRIVVKNFKTRDEAMKHSLDIQFGRRNLDSTQRAMAYAKLPRFAHGGERTEEANGDAEQGANLRLAELAKQAGVSERTMEFAAKVADHGSAEIKKAASAGEVSVSDAAAIVHLPKEKQTAALKKVRDGKVSTLREAAPKRRRKATDFDPVELENQASKNGRAAKSGAPAVSVKARKELAANLGKLIRSLDTCGLGDEFANCTNEMSARIKKI
jgi:hypothetical protein